MTVKTEDELNTDFADSQFRGITAEKIRDLVDSRFAVGGVMHGQDTSQGITAGVTNFSAYDVSSDTKGVIENLVTGEYTIESGGGGAYSLAFVAVIEAPGAGDIEFGFHKNDSVAATPFRCKLPVQANTPTLFTITGGASAVAGDRFGVKWQGSGNATINVNDVQFRVVRA